METHEPSSEPHVPTLVVGRGLTRLNSIDRQIKDWTRGTRYRDDLRGLKLLMRALDVTNTAMQHSLVTSMRKLSASYVAPDPRTSSEYKARKRVPFERRLAGATKSMREFELEVGHWGPSFFGHPQGRTFDALATPLIRLAKRISGDRDLEIIFKPEPNSRYKLYPDVLSKFREIALGADPRLKQTFDTFPVLMAIEYPRFFEGDTFQHAVIAHEIAHIALRNDDIGETLLAEALAQLRSEGIEVDPRESDEKTPWFEELACDVLATRLVGPAFLMALVQFHLVTNIWLHPLETTGAKTHPPLYWRVRRVEQALEPFIAAAEANDSQRWRMAKEVINRWLAVTPKFEVPQTPTTDAIERALNQVDARAGEILRGTAYDPNEFAADLDPIWGKLEAHIAPAEAIYERGDRDRPAEVDLSEWSVPIDWRSILNGGLLHFEWCQLIEGGPQVPPTLLTQVQERQDARASACEQIRGAIELSELHREMAQRRDELKGLAIEIAPR